MSQWVVVVVVGKEQPIEHRARHPRQLLCSALFYVPTPLYSRTQTVKPVRVLPRCVSDAQEQSITCRVEHPSVAGRVSGSRYIHAKNKIKARSYSPV